MIVCIPARYQSTRLPGKPLIPLNNKPMIHHTFDRAAEVFPHSAIYVLTESPLILEYCQSHDIQCLMTPDTCASGTDRIASALPQLPHSPTIIDIQGDEPLADPKSLQRLRVFAQAHPGDIIAGYAPIKTPAAFFDPNCIKVIFDADHTLLYTSRAPIPLAVNASFPQGHAYKQVTHYAYPREALQFVFNHPDPGPLETVETIELIRFLEHGIPVRLIPMTPGISVNVRSDVPLAERALRCLPLSS